MRISRISLEGLRSWRATGSESGVGELGPMHTPTPAARAQGLACWAGSPSWCRRLCPTRHWTKEKGPRKARAGNPSRFGRVGMQSPQLARPSPLRAAPSLLKQVTHTPALVMHACLHHEAGAAGPTSQALSAHGTVLQKACEQCPQYSYMIAQVNRSSACCSATDRPCGKRKAAQLHAAVRPRACTARNQATTEPLRALRPARAASREREPPCLGSGSRRALEPPQLASTSTPAAPFASDASHAVASLGSYMNMDAWSYASCMNASYSVLATR
jgi:hypothetical protein